MHEAAPTKMWSFRNGKETRGMSLETKKKEP